MKIFEELLASDDEDYEEIKVSQMQQEQLSPSGRASRLSEFLEKYDCSVASIRYVYSLEKVRYLQMPDQLRANVDETVEESAEILGEADVFLAKRGLLVARSGVRGFVDIDNRRISLVLDPPYTGDASLSRAATSDFKKWWRGELEPE